MKNEKTIVDDDDSIIITFPIDIDELSASELMEIAIVMQSQAQKKRLKQQRKEAETIQTVVDILSSLLPETDTSNLSTPIGKLGQLVTNATDQLKSLEEATHTLDEKNYRKKRGEQLMLDIDKGKISLSVNLRTVVEIGGKLLAYTSKVSFFYSNLKKRREDTKRHK